MPRVLAFTTVVLTALATTWRGQARPKPSSYTASHRGEHRLQRDPPPTERSVEGGQQDVDTVSRTSGEVFRRSARHMGLGGHGAVGTGVSF